MLIHKISTTQLHVSNFDIGAYKCLNVGIYSLFYGISYVFWTTARTDQKGQIIRANPIFDTGRTRMPARWQFLNQIFDDAATIFDIAVETAHKRLDLVTLHNEAANDLQQMVKLVFCTRNTWTSHKSQTMVQHLWMCKTMNRGCCRWNWLTKWLINAYLTFNGIIYLALH